MAPAAAQPRTVKAEAPEYRRPEVPSKLAPFVEAVHQALLANARRPKQEGAHGEGAACAACRGGLRRRVQPTNRLHPGLACRAGSRGRGLAVHRTSHLVQPRGRLCVCIPAHEKRAQRRVTTASRFAVTHVGVALAKVQPTLRNRPGT